MRTPPQRAITLGVSLVLSMGVTLGCGPRSSSEAPLAPDPIQLAGTRGYIVISLDTLRADHLGCYGYALDTSPFLDRLAERSLLFETAIVQYPSTLTSHMSMLTGLYPEQHGVYPPRGVLPEEVPLLQEIFRDAGYRTAGFAEGGYVRGRFGFRRGFDTFVSRDRKGGEGVEQTFERGLRFLRGLDSETPFFLFLHTYAVHAPYQPPQEFREMFWPGPAPPGAFPPTGAELRRHNESGATLDAETARYFAALYDAEIRHLDGVLEAFFDELDRLGFSDQTTIVVTSDHGEEFQEHGRVNHDQLYHEVLHVPLLLLHPELEDGGRIDGLVESVDITPTLLGLARLESPLDLPGRPLLPQPSEPPSLAWAYAEAGAGREAAYVLEGGALLHLLTFRQPVLRHELYDLSADPLERFDLSDTLEHTELAERLRSFELEPLGRSGEIELDPELQERLRALGYVD